MPHYEESDFGLLENTNAKLPIILRKLGEMEDGQEIQVEEHSCLLNGEEGVYGVDVDTKRQALEQDTQGMSRKKEVRKDVDSALDSVGSSTQKCQKEIDRLSGCRTEHNTIKNSE